MIKISREMARVLGLRFYYTGDPCAHGHDAERYVSSNACRVCQCEHSKRWISENKERARVNTIRWLEGHPGYHKNRYLNNRSKLDKQNAEWRLNNRDKVKENKRKSNARHPATLKAQHQRRRTRKANAIGSFSSQDVVDLYNKQDGRCVYCGIALGDGYHIDHRVPLARGGSNNPINLQLLCPSCNLKKHSSDPIEFIERMGVSQKLKVR